MMLGDPISYHLDLYRYWLAKRESRHMPARRDLRSADLKHLLPHLIISEREADQFRHRLFGSAVVRTLGFDATNYFVGEYLNNPYFHAEAKAAYELVYALRDPAFATGAFCFKGHRTGALHAWSTIVLPLSEDQVTVNKTISSFISRLDPRLKTPEWLEYQPAKVLGVDDVEDAGEPKRFCLEWEQRH